MTTRVASRVTRAGLTVALTVGLSGCFTTSMIAARVTQSDKVFGVGLYGSPWVDAGAIAAIGLSENGFASWDGDAKPVAILLGVDAAAALLLLLVLDSARGVGQLGG